MVVNFAKQQALRQHLTSCRIVANLRVFNRDRGINGENTTGI